MFILQVEAVCAEGEERDNENEEDGAESLQIRGGGSRPCQPSERRESRAEQASDQPASQPEYASEELPRPRLFFSLCIRLEMKSRVRPFLPKR